MFVPKRSGGYLRDVPSEHPVDFADRTPKSLLRTGMSLEINEKAKSGG
jgi:hypothetical protein